MIDNEVKKVVYVGGWNSAKSDFTKIEALLAQTYPNATLERFDWDSSGSWEDALQNAETAAQNLRARLLAETPETLRDLVLVGHSLGARIAIGATRDATPPLNRIVLLGAAIDGDSPDVAQAARFSARPLANVYSPFDVVLSFYRLAQGVRAFGRRGAAGNYALNVPSVNGSLSQTAALLLAPLAPAPLRLLAAIQNAVLQSHCFADYLKTWRDFDPAAGRATLETERWTEEVPSDVVEAIAATLTRWLSERSNAPCDVLAILGDETARSALDGVRKISAVANQLGPGELDWNCVVDALDDKTSEPMQISFPLNVDGSWDAAPEKIRAQFLKTNCRSYELIIYNVKGEK
ncbi:MAG: DUF726 domain-containing protein [Thermoguttaceae bacterium]|nr:DUF726 domain-containing protein [Thermoguttaceae bacterium]